MKNIVDKKIRGLGFIEVLIAIVVVGIVSAVFLTIAGTAMKDLVQAERIEYMAQLAKDGVNIAQEVANREKANIVTTVENNYFPDEAGLCYLPIIEGSGGDVEYKFEKESYNFVSFEQQTFDRNAVVDHVKKIGNPSNYLAGQQYFVLMCIDKIDEFTGWANIRIRVGDTDLKGEKSSDSDVRDFIYYAVIDL